MIATQDTLYVNQNLYISTDEIEIIDLLADNKLMPKNFLKNQVIPFFHNDDFCLVLFFAEAGDKGFHLYVVEDFSINVREMQQLSNVFGDFLADGYNYTMMKQAKDEVDTLVAMAPTFRALLNKPEPEEEYWS